MFSALAFLIVSSSRGQGGATGAILGSVRDSSGALVADASVKLTNAESGLARTLSTGSNGDFVASLLPVGHYRVLVNAQGFAPEIAENIEVRVTEMTRVSFTLKPGTVATEVVVAANIAQVHTTDASTGEAIGSETIQGLPLATRHFQKLLTLSSGASTSCRRARSNGTSP